MTPRERVLKTLRFEEPDRVPFFEQGVDSANASNILGREAITGGGNARFRSMVAGWEGPDAYAEQSARSRDDWADLIDALDMDAVTGAWTGGGVPSARIDELTFRFDDPATDTWTIQRFSPDSDTLYEVDSSLMSEGMPALERVMAHRIEHYQTPTPDPDAHGDLKWRLERFHPHRAVAGMDLAEIREKLPHLVLWGNVDCAGALVTGAPEDVATETRACIDKAAAGGGYILGSSNVIHSQCLTDNFLAMVETCREYGIY